MNAPIAAQDEDLQLHVLLMKKHENERHFYLKKRLDFNAMGCSEGEISSAEWCCVCDQVNLSCSLKAFKTGIITDNDLQEAQRFFEKAYMIAERKHLVFRLSTLQQLVSCKGQRYKLFGTLAADAPLDSLAEHDRVYMEQRMAKSILRGADNLIARAEVLARWSFTNHYDFAIGYCMEAIGAGQLRNTYHRHIQQIITFVPSRPPPPSRDLTTLFTEVINWAQRKKARSVTEALGAEVILSPAILASANLDQHAHELLQQEADRQMKLDKNQGDAIQLNRELNTIRMEMRGCPTLMEITSLRDGQALNREQIKSLARSLGSNVLIVDYLCIQTAFTGLQNHIIPMVYRGGELVSAHMVTPDLSLDNIQRWISTYLDDQRQPLADPSALKGLFPLIEAAVKFSKPGDHILLCPSDILFRIPLHAIDLPDGQPWIQRNPIIYTQSLSIFRFCQTAASSFDNEFRPKVLAVQALSDRDLERPEVADMAFASQVKARLLRRQELNKRSFLQACTEAELVHFYGHVSYDQPKAMDQYLAIRDIQSERVTVRDLFDLRMRTGAHVNLIGCQSGRSQAGINDDLLGLSTALMFAGATSIVAALWSIQMDDGASLQEAFFDEVISQSRAKDRRREWEECTKDEDGDDGLRKFLDLAVAVQKAILNIRVDAMGRARTPYHWAGFFLQGCWNKFPTLKDLE